MQHLSIGDLAPPFSVAEFVRGEPVAGFAPGRVTVVEFWATWCGPCVSSIPHLSALQAAYPHIVVLAIAVRETDPAVVRAFVAEQGTAMAYTVALDAQPEVGATAGPTFEAWCDASYRMGIPAAFIVDGEGRIAWIGHPLELDGPLAEVIAGRWDRAAQAEAHDATLHATKAREIFRLTKEAQRSFRGGDSPGALGIYDAVFAEHPDLERRYGLHKLFVLSRSDVGAALAYARKLESGSGKDEPDLDIRFMLVDALEDLAKRGVALDPALVAFILDGLEKASRSAWPADALGREVAIKEHLAKAHLALGDPDAALLQARGARDCATAQATEPALLENLEALIERCAAPLSRRPAGEPNLVCEDGLCRIGPS